MPQEREAAPGWVARCVRTASAVGGREQQRAAGAAEAEAAADEKR